MALNSYFSDGGSAAVKTADRPQRIKKEKPFFSWLLRNASFISLIILILVALFVLLFTFEVSVEVILATLLSPGLYTIIALSYAIFVNSYAVGGDVRKKNDKYLKVIEAYEEQVRNVRDNGLIKELDRFVDNYKREELAEFKKTLLMDIHFTEEDYELYLKGEYKGTTTKTQIKILKQVANAKPIHLTTQMLLAVGKQSSRRGTPVSSLEAIKAFKAWQFFKRGATIIITTLFGVSIAAQFNVNDINSLFGVIIQASIFVSSIVCGFISANSVYAKYEDRTKEVTVFLAEFSRQKNLGKTWEKSQPQFNEELKTQGNIGNFGNSNFAKI